MARKRRQEESEQTLEGAESMAAAEAAIEAEKQTAEAGEAPPEGADDGNQPWYPPVYDDSVSNVDEAGAEAFAHAPDEAQAVEMAKVPDEAAHAMDEVVAMGEDETEATGEAEVQATSAAETTGSAELVASHDGEGADGVDLLHATDAMDEPAAAADAEAIAAAVGGTMQDGHVEIERGATQAVHATDVHMNQGAAQRIQGETVTISQGAAVVVQGGRVNVQESGVVAIVGRRVDASQSNAFLLIARNVSGDVRAVLDWRGIVAGAVAIVLLRRITRRR